MTAPLKFALVLVDPIYRPSCCDKGESTGCCFAEGHPQYCLADIEQKERDAMLADSPGNDLLKRIVRARDIAGSCQHGTPEWLNAVDELYLTLNELGGENG